MFRLRPSRDLRVLDLRRSQKRGFAHVDELASLRSCANPLRSTGTVNIDVPTKTV